MTLQPTRFILQNQRYIAREYRRLGYGVLPNPTPEQLPAFLAPFSIGILARNNEENVVIGVRTRSSLTGEPRLDAIARALEGKPDWRFELVVRNSRAQA